MDAIDIYLVDNDISIKDGDIDIGYSDQQHIEHIFRANQGQYYQHPLVGIGIDKQLNSGLNSQDLRQTIKTQLEADNYKVNDIDLDTKNGFNVTVDAIRLK